MSALSTLTIIVGIAQAAVNAVLIYRKRREIIAGHAVLYPAHYA